MTGEICQSTSASVCILSELVPDGGINYWQSPLFTGRHPRMQQIPAFHTYLSGNDKQDPMCSWSTENRHIVQTFLIVYSFLLALPGNKVCSERWWNLYSLISASAGQAGRAAVLEEADNSCAEHYSISRLHPLWLFLICSWVTTPISWHMFSVCSFPFYILPVGILEAFLPSTHKCTLMSLKPQIGLALGAWVDMFNFKCMYSICCLFSHLLFLILIL